MKIEKYNALKQQFENQPFEAAYKHTSLILYGASILGNVFSVIFAYFFVNALTASAAVHFAGQAIILPIFIVLFLTAFELMKRFIFGNLVTTYLISKKLTTSFIVSVVFALMIIGGSFYLSMSGAQTYVNKETTIVNSTDSLIQTKTDSLNKLYTVQIDKVEQELQYVYTAAQTRRKSALTANEVIQVKELKSQIGELKSERDKKILTVKSSIEQKNSKELNKTNNSQFAFLLISFFIELVILVGVVFNRYYNYFSFIETKEKIESNPAYHKLNEQLELVDIIYNNGKVNVNATLPSINKIKEIVNSGRFNKVGDKNLREFLALLQYLKVTEISGKTRRIMVSYDEAKDKIKNHFPIE